VQKELSNVDNNSSGYEIKPDRQQRIIRIRMWGLWDEATMDRYISEYERIVNSWAPGPFFMLGIATEWIPNPQNADRLGATMELAHRAGVVRVAIAVGMAASQMQMRRVGREDQERFEVEVQYFDTVDKAEEWLLATEPIAR
jgi:hypothetical protein